MQRTSTLRQFAWTACVCAGIALAWAPGADAADPPPAVSPDVLVLRPALLNVEVEADDRSTAQGKVTD